jgi:hypothetical protein
LTYLGEEFNLIEVNNDDIKPDPREWMTKALTDESERGDPGPKCTIKGQKKRKHQVIIFLSSLLGFLIALDAPLHFDSILNLFKCRLADHLPRGHGQGEGACAEATVGHKCTDPQGHTVKVRLLSDISRFFGIKYSTLLYKIFCVSG